MKSIVFQRCTRSLISIFNNRSFSVSSTLQKTYTCKLLVLGGGTGGCSTAAKFSRKSKSLSIIILEPSSNHYYQPLWTLVGAGVKSVETTRRDMHSVLPKGPLWLKDSAVSIDPEKNTVTTGEGHVIGYEYLVVSVGMKYDYHKVPGLLDALNEPRSGVATIYDVKFVENVYKLLQQFKGGDAVFTFPDSNIKCPGAPQKIAYLADSYFTKSGVRSKTNITYNSALPVIFGVKKYADALMKVVERKRINVGFNTVLKEVKPDCKEAVFNVKQGDKPGKLVTMKYDMLHVTPPMSPPDFLKKNKALTDEAGYLNVDKFTLRHVRYPNIFGIGDCTNTPNSKTAAAVAKQLWVVGENLSSAMEGRPTNERYDGYGACPLLTSYNTCIMAEFLYGGVPHETLPFNQAQESIIAYYMKRDLFPFIYWNFMLKGIYHGPETIRKFVNPFGWN